MTMLQRAYFLSILLLPTLSLYAENKPIPVAQSTAPQVHEVDAPDDQDFLFLAEDDLTPVAIPDTEDEEVIQVPKEKS